MAQPNSRLEERVPQAPAEQRPDARRIRRHKVADHTRLRVARLILRHEVARVDREHLPADLERQVVRRRAGERGVYVGVRCERGGYRFEDGGDEVLWAAEE